MWFIMEILSAISSCFGKRRNYRVTTVNSGADIELKTSSDEGQDGTPDSNVKKSMSTKKKLAIVFAVALAIITVTVGLGTSAYFLQDHFKDAMKDDPINKNSTEAANNTAGTPATTQANNTAGTPVTTQANNTAGITETPTTAPASSSDVLLMPSITQTSIPASSMISDATPTETPTTAPASSSDILLMPSITQTSIPASSMISDATPTETPTTAPASSSDILLMPSITQTSIPASSMISDATPTETPTTAPASSSDILLMPSITQTSIPASSMISDATPTETPTTAPASSSNVLSPSNTPLSPSITPTATPASSMISDATPTETPIATPASSSNVLSPSNTPLSPSITPTATPASSMISDATPTETPTATTQGTTASTTQPTTEEPITAPGIRSFCGCSAFNAAYPVCMNESLAFFTPANVAEHYDFNEYQYALHRCDELNGCAPCEERPVFESLPDSCFYNDGDGDCMYEFRFADQCSQSLLGPDPESERCNDILSMESNSPILDFNQFDSCFISRPVSTNTPASACPDYLDY